MRTSNNFLSSTAFNLQPQKQIEVVLLSYQSNLSAPTPDPPTGHPTPTTYHLITTAAAAAAAAASCHLLNLNQIMLTTNPRGSSRCETRDKGIDMVVAVPTMLSMHATVPEGTATATVNSVMSFKSPLLSNPSMHHLLLLPPPPLPTADTSFCDCHGHGKVDPSQIDMGALRGRTRLHTSDGASQSACHLPSSTSFVALKRKGATVWMPGCR